MGCGTSKAVTTVQPLITPAVCRAHFEAERVIGQGGFGRVDAVTKTVGYDKDTSYAMKTLSKAVVLERNHVGMVMKERNLLARLHCPQLVNMHYSFQDERNLYIVMDLCLGGDLHYQLSQQPNKCFSEEQSRIYVAEIILCLEYMHGAGVLHRDIKPENLLLDSEGQLKVTDLGVSSETIDDVCAATSGTRPYMAPEIFMAGHKHSYVSDFYALGITAFQLMLGQRPYKPDTANLKAIVRMSTFIPPERYTDLAQIRRILINAQERKAPSAEFRYSQFLSRVSPEARDFVQMCLICNPKFRLGSEGMSELKNHPWFKGLDWDALATQSIAPIYVPDLSALNSSIGAAASAQLVLDEEAAASAPPIPAAEQAKFVGYEYRVHANDDKAGRTERVPYRRGSIDASEDLNSGPDSMRHSTITMAQTTEILNGASVANYASINYRGTEVGGSGIYGSPSSPASVSGSASKKALGMGVSSGSTRNAGSGLYVLTPSSSPVHGPPQVLSPGSAGSAAGPSVPVIPGTPPGRVPVRSNSFALEQARLAALELHENLVIGGDIPVMRGASVHGADLDSVAPSGAAAPLGGPGRRSSFKGSRISNSVRNVAALQSGGAYVVPAD